MKAINEKTGDIIELKGGSIDNFEREEKISEIILIGKKGGIRRIILEWSVQYVI